MVIDSVEAYNQHIQPVLDEHKKSDRVFVIGGGPSLKSVLPDPSVISSEDVIAVNNAYKLFPNAITCHFADKTWWGWHSDVIRSIYQGPLITSRHLNNDKWAKTTSLVHCFTKPRFGKDGITEEITALSGSNSGHQAINLAIKYGYKTIVLIGFDMDSSSPATHWHDEHRRPTNVDNYKNTMLPGMEQISKYIKEKRTDIKIVNLNPKSMITCFPFGNLSDYV